MKGKQRIELFRTHKMLLQEKDEKIGTAQRANTTLKSGPSILDQMIQLRMNEFRDAVAIIVEELGISKKDKWTLTEDGQAIEITKDGDK